LESFLSQGRSGEVLSKSRQGLTPMLQCIWVLRLLAQVGEGLFKKPLSDVWKPSVV